MPGRMKRMRLLVRLIEPSRRWQGSLPAFEGFKIRAAHPNHVEYPNAGESALGHELVVGRRGDREFFRNISNC